VQDHRVLDKPDHPSSEGAFPIHTPLIGAVRPRIQAKAAEQLAGGYWVLAATLPHLRQTDAGFVGGAACSGDGRILVSLMRLVGSAHDQR
jgi:hypothetical protein